VTVMISYYEQYATGRKRTGIMYQYEYLVSETSLGQKD